MSKPGPLNLITDVCGLVVGNAEDEAVRTGVSVVIVDSPALAAVDIRGGAPGTRETDVLDPVNLVGSVDAIVLSGGSAYGLAACSGVMEVLGLRGRGFRVSDAAPPVPIVPGAILFDLANGGDKSRLPYADLGRVAAELAGTSFPLGNCGAGFGALAGAYKGGLGSASVVSDDGFTVGALVAVNAVGSPVMPGCDAFWAWPFEYQGEFGGRRPPADWHMPPGDLPADLKAGGNPSTNTTIAVIATDAALSRVELKRLAVMAADGFAHALRPAHSPFDGDAVFAVGTARHPVNDAGRAQTVMRLGTLAADCMARSIARGVYAADTLGDATGYGEHFGV